MPYFLKPILKSRFKVCMVVSVVSPSWVTFFNIGMYYTYIQKKLFEFSFSQYMSMVWQTKRQNLNTKTIFYYLDQECTNRTTTPLQFNIAHVLVICKKQQKTFLDMCLLYCTMYITSIKFHKNFPIRREGLLNFWNMKW